MSGYLLIRSLIARNALGETWIGWPRRVSSRGSVSKTQSPKRTRMGVPTESSSIPQGSSTTSGRPAGHPDYRVGNDEKVPSLLPGVIIKQVSG